MKKAIILILMFLLVFACTKKEDKKDTTTTVVPDKLNKCIITSVEGKVFITNDANTNMVSATVGDKLKEDDSIKTDNGSSAEVQIGEGSVVRIKENSVLKLAKLLKEKESQKTTLFLKSGKILAKPEHQTEGSSFDIQTETVTAGVRGTEFVVITDANTTKIAVSTGAVKVKNNINPETFEKLNKINPELAEKLKHSMEAEQDVAPDQKVVIKNEEVKNMESSVTKEVAEIVVNLEKNKDSKEATEAIIKQVETEKINQITANTAKLAVKETVTDTDWNKEFNKKEFEEIKVIVIEEPKKEDVKKEEPKKEEPKKEEPKKETPKKVEKKDTKKDTEKVAAVKKEEKPKEFVRTADKFGSIPGVSFAEKSTAVVSNDSGIYISSDTSKSVICVNPKTGKVAWKFSNSKIKSIFSPAIPFRGNVILGTFETIYVIGPNGTVKSSKDIENGPTFWSTPVVGKDSIYIPTARSIFSYAGGEITELKGYPQANGQLYLSADNDSLLVVEPQYNILKQFDLNTKSVVWTSDKLLSPIYSSPIFVGKYFVVADSTGNLYRFDSETKSTKPDVIKIGAGVMSNLVAKGNSVYFVAKDGSFYKANVTDFSAVSSIVKVDTVPDANKYLAKKTLISGADIYFSSDSGKLFHYNLANGTNEFISLPDNAANLPLVGTPAKIGEDLFVIDTKANIYKIYMKLKD